jgi:predicted Co/Zn/Cd cation transporter (cation efflux family)
MTDETPGTGPAEGNPEEPTPAAEHDMAAVTQGAGDFTSGEGLVALSGIVLLLIWLVWDVFLDDYGIGSIALLVSVAVVVVPRLKKETVETVHPVPVIMKLAGYTLATIGAFSVISAIESGFYEGASTIIAALLSYAAYAMAFLGARQIDT